MPYIAQEDRETMVVETQGSMGPQPGQLNYAIALLINDYLSNFPKKNYEVLNSVVGVLESAKLEFYRRVIVPYENQKIFENGDVYELYEEGKKLPL